MDAGKLLANFDLVIAAPGGVARVREMILQLAVRGLLVPQDPADGTASEILNMDRYQKNNASDMPSLQNNLPILPSEWCWVRLADLAELSIGRTPDTKNHSYWGSAGFEWVNIADMAHGGILYETKRKVSALAKTDVFRKAPESAGTLLMSYKLTIGKISILGVPAYHNEAIAAIKPDIQEVQNYLLKVLPVFALSGEVNNAIKGRTLNKKTLSALPVAVPPLAEQKRIVAKIDELMSLCDELNEKKQRRDNTHKTLQSSTFNTLATANTPAATTKAWTRIRDHWPTLLSTPESIATLRQLLLSLAFRGRLTERENCDGNSGADVAEAARSELSALVQNKAARKGAELLSISPAEIPHEIPKTWAWARLGSVCIYNSGERVSGVDISPGAWLLELEDIQKTTSRLLNRVRSRERNSKSTKSSFEVGDVLYGKLRPYLDKALVADENGYCTTEIIPLRPLGGIIPDFLRWAVKRPDFVSYAVKNSYGINLPRLGTTDGKNAPIPIPPLAEQKRIAAKIDELMSLCDALESRMGDQSSTSRDLARALSASP